MVSINNNPNIDKPFARDIPFEPVSGITETNVQKAIESVSSVSAPVDAQYYLAAANAALTNGIVVPAFIQTLLDDTSQGDAQATLGLVPGTDVQNYSANLDLWSAEVPTNYALLATLASTANGNGASLIGIEDSGALITATTVEGALAENRTAINAIGVDYLSSSDIGVSIQAYDADLDTWAGLTPSANFQTLVTQTFAQMRASLDLEAGTDFYSISGANAAFQPLDSDLTAIAALTTTSFGRGLLESASASALFTAIKQAATTSATGVVELTLAAEVTAGTDTARAITPDSFAGSDYGKSIMMVQVFANSETCATGDDAADGYVHIPSELNGYNLVDVACSVGTAGTTGSMTIQIHNVTDTVDMLSSLLTLGSGATHSETATINASNDDVATGDRLRIDVDSVHTTPAEGLMVELVFQLP